MAFCVHCGQPIRDDVQNCPSCGAAIGEEPAEDNAREASSVAMSLDRGLTPQVQQLAREGHKIQAIKVYRESTGASLKDAKDAIEEWMRREGVSSSSGCSASLLLLLLILFGAGLCRL